MMHGRNNGKKLKAVRIIRQALEIVALLNPVNPCSKIVALLVLNTTFLTGWVVHRY